MNDYRPIHRSPLLRPKHLLQQPPRHRGAEGHRLQARKTNKQTRGKRCCASHANPPGLSASFGAASGLAKPSGSPRRGAGKRRGHGRGAAKQRIDRLGGRAWTGRARVDRAGQRLSPVGLSPVGRGGTTHPDVPLLRDLARWPPAVRMRHGRAVRGRVPVSTMRGGPLAGVT